MSAGSEDDVTDRRVELDLRGSSQLPHERGAEHPRAPEDQQPEGSRRVDFVCACRLMICRCHRSTLLRRSWPRMSSTDVTARAREAVSS